MGKVVLRGNLMEIRAKLKQQGRTVVFTNGCFDILHRGHVEYLGSAKALGDVLIVGVNSDNSVRRIKGNGRPIVSEGDRAFVLSALKDVDFVCLFDEDTPFELIREIVPDILVKGADWNVKDVVGKEIVEQAGGSVRTIPIVSDRSTSGIIGRIRGMRGGAELHS